MQRGVSTRLTACRPEVDNVQTHAKELLRNRISGSAPSAKADRRCLLGVVAVLLLSLCTPPVWAQAVATGTITGTVTDNTGAVVLGATVTVISKATGDTRSTTTNDVGHFIFQNVDPGSYTIKFKKPGFSELVVTDATVQVGTQLNENVTMKLGAVSTTVTVTETAGAELQTMNSTVGQTVSGTALDSLPAIGHDVVTFAVLQPGVSPLGSVAGTLMDQSSFTLDGGNNTNDMDGGGQSYTPSFGGDPTGGVIAGGGLRAGNQTGGVPSGIMPTPSDSVEEIKVNSANQTADFNASSGSQVEIVTRRGGNSWHGSGYEYYLDNNLNANTWDNNVSGTPLPSYHYSFFGGRAGGPIIPKEILGGKTYFFANYQGFRWPNSATYERAVPSDAMRLGLLQFAGTVYNLNPTAVTYNGTTYPGTTLDPRGIGINPVVQAMWNKFEPETNDPGCSLNSSSRCDGVNEQGFKSNLATPIRDDFAVTRVDHDFGSKWHFNTSWRYYRLLHTTTSQVDIGGGLPGDTLGHSVAVSNKPIQPWFYVAGLTTNITSNATNDFHYSYLRNFWSWADANAPPQPGTNSTGVLEPLGESGDGVLAPYNVDNQDIRTRFWDGHDNTIRDDVTILHGNHLLQFGGTYERNWNYHQRTDNGGGINYTLTYQLGDTSGAGLITGLPAALSSVTAARDYAAVLGMVTDSQVAYTRQGANLTLNPPQTPAYDQSTIPYYNVYFSDSWHFKPSLTATFGLGWTLELPPTEANGKQVLLVDDSGQQVDVASYLNQRKLAALQGNVYNPEIGFALVGNTGSHQKYPFNPYYGGLSPRLALAWNPRFDSGSMMAKIFGENSTVVRGGYGRIYGRLDGVGLVLVPLLGTGLIQAVQCRQVFASGACGPSNPTANTAFRIGVDGNTAPLATPSPTLPQPDFPGFNAVAAGAGTVLDDHFQPNVVDSFDLTIQRQFGPKWMIEVGYIGRRITHELQPININAVPHMMTLGGQSFAQAYAAVETAMGCATSIVACNSATAATTTVAPQPFFEAALSATGYCTPGNCTATVVANQFSNFQNQKVWSLWSALDKGGIGGGPGGSTVPGFNFARTMLNSPINTSALGASGQDTTGIGVDSSLGSSNYNGGFVSLRTNDWHGITAQQNFTYSKALGTGGEVQATSSFTTDDPYNLKEMYGPQFFNQKFVYNLFIVYQPPYFKGQSGVLGHILGGWNLSPILTAGTGLPIFCNTQTDAQSFGAADGVGYAENEECIFTKPYTGGLSLHYGVPGGMDAAGDSVGTNTAGSLPGQEVNVFANPVAVWNTVRAPILGIDKRDNGSGILPGIRYWNMDFSVKKNVKLNERFNAEVQFLFVNVFNHNQLGASPLATPDQMDLSNSPSFGVYNAEASTPRQMEFGLRFNF
jgi:Carboxypeptidase regulatory-like domain